MADDAGKKKGFHLSGILSFFHREASAKGQLRHLRAEMGRQLSELELMRQDVENLKKEAGARAYDFWMVGALNQESLDAYFQGVKCREESIVKQTRILAALKERIEHLQTQKPCGDNTVMLGITAAEETVDIKSDILADSVEDVHEDGIFFTCPSCGARFEYPAKFCRFCGARMGFLEIEAGGMTSVAECEEAVSVTEIASVKEPPDEVAFTGEAYKTMVLETSRLTLRTLDHGDYDSLSVILRDPEVMYAYEHGFEEEEVKAWLELMLARYKQYGFALWAVILKETGQFIGQCGITMQEADGKQVMEVGYLFAKAFWHRGYAAEAAVACREYAFNSLGADAVYSIIREGNEASERVAKRNGMKNCGSVLKHYYNMDMPHNIYRITRGEWEIQAGMNTHFYQWGVIDCFNEMLQAGLKRIAMSHPCRTKEERDAYLPFCNNICEKYGTSWYSENEAFLTDLFPEELNRNTYNIIFYRKKEELNAYLALKKRRDRLVSEGRYDEEGRYWIAFEFGKLLSYPEEAIYQKIRETRTGGEKQKQIKA